MRDGVAGFFGKGKKKKKKKAKKLGASGQTPLEDWKMDDEKNKLESALKSIESGLESKNEP